MLVLHRPVRCARDEAVQFFHRPAMIGQLRSTGRFARRPFSEQVEQHGVVRLVCFGRVRPVAPPDEPLGRGFDIGLPDPVDVRVAGRPIPAAVIGHRQFDPGAALVEQPANDREGRVIDAQEKPQADAVVYLQNQKSLEVRTYITTEDGSYRFGQLGSDVDYQLWAKFQSSKSKTRSISSFDSKKQFNFDLKLEPSK